MGYKPKRKYLNDDAVPTIFADSKPQKARKTSNERIQRQENKQVIDYSLVISIFFKSCLYVRVGMVGLPKTH